MNDIYLKVPTLSEMKYRNKWMQDSKTMEYNSGYDIAVKGYDKETGTITLDEEMTKIWYEKWIGHEPNRYFAYIYDANSDATPVGEVYFYYNSDLDLYNMGIVISSCNRGKGYSSKALKKLEEVAFLKYKINALSDIIPVDRIGAIKSFKKAGFIETNLVTKGTKFGVEEEARQLLITKEMYEKNNL